MQHNFCYLYCKLDRLPHLTFIVSTPPQMTSFRRLLRSPTEISIYNFAKEMWNVPFFQIYSTMALANPVIRYNNTVQERAYMDEATYLYWTSAAWHSFCLNRQPTWRTMDSWAAHESSSIKEALRKLGYHVDVSLWIQLPDSCVDNIVALNHLWSLFENLKLWIAKNGSVFKIEEEIRR